MRNTIYYLSGLYYFIIILLNYYIISSQKYTPVFVLAGQSNMVGHAETREAVDNEDSRISVLNGNGEWKSILESDIEFRKGPAIFFARKILEKRRNVGLIHCAVDRSTIEEWNDKLLYKCIEKINVANLGRDRKLAAILFMEGESEAFNCESDWKDMFGKMISKLRKELGVGFPVIFAQIADISVPCCENVQKQQETVNIPGVSMIKTNDLWVGKDFHFNIEGYKILGERFAQAYFDFNYDFIKKIIS